MEEAMNEQNQLPQRKKLPHEIPSWVAQGSRHFITINCRERENGPLLQFNIAERLLDNARFYEETGKWYLWLALIMPDHVHLIATFDLANGLKSTVSAWKRYQTRTLGIDWQSDFFEHRLRNQAEFDEKSHYIRMNPVRKNLVNAPEQWPHVIDRTTIKNGSLGQLALPENAEQIGRANSPSEPPRRIGSGGDVALPFKEER
jgi:REP element-mobilizing transposase RayT